MERWITENSVSTPENTSFIGLSPLGKALSLSALNAKSSKAIVAIFQSKAEARSVVDNLKFLLGDKASHRIHYIPSNEFDYHKGVFPSEEGIAERNIALFDALNDSKNRIFVSSMAAMIQKVIPSETYLESVLSIVKDQEVDRDELVSSLLGLGYQRQPVAYDPGVFSIRGGVVDIYCPLYTQPVRIEFFGDLVEQIRHFDAKSQRSLEEVTELNILPVTQTIIPRGEAWNVASEKIKNRLDAQGISKADREAALGKIQEGQVGGQLGYLFPLLSNGSESFFDYFPKDSQLIWDGKDGVLNFLEETEYPRLETSHDAFERENAPIAEFEDLFLNDLEIKEAIERKPHFFFENFEANQSELNFKLPYENIVLANEREQSQSQSGKSNVLEPYAKKFRDWLEQGYRVHVVCHTQMHAERMQLLFEAYEFESKIHSSGTASFPEIYRAEDQKLHLWQGFLTESIQLPSLKVVLLSEEQVFGHKKRFAKSRAWSSSADRTLSSFRELRINDYIVHKDHGVGRYLGLKSMNFQGVDNDYVILEYKEGDKLYLPVYRLNVIQKYVGGEGVQPFIDKLGGDRWTKVKQKAQKAAQEVAAELLQIQAKRKLVPAHAFRPNGQEYQQFEMEFPFDETPDQQKAIDDVNADLTNSHPMERLVVGDVGYGKTEVAIRAAFRAAHEGKQVAILVPTTVLAFQHYENIRERFKNTPIEVDMVCRLKTTAQNKLTVEKLKNGKVDVVIGTHRLLSSDVQFKDLGLLIIDEEHRFGVSHKEKLKKIAASVHVVSMTATPIPRTLNMAMAGIKDISIIATPPPDRLSVRTFVCRNSPEVISEAISNELGRGGQVFFLHNRVQSIHLIADQIRELFPKVKMQVAHGQMDGKTLEEKMLGFYRGDFDILICTTIIESGLDVPRANTIIIDEAHRLGLAQLYQIRGRVGRSDRRAYCYLLSPPEASLTKDAKQRLQVIQRYSDLGSGFQVASQDMEIRGAGDLLGTGQSGHLNAVGIEMYFQLLDESIGYLKGHEAKIEIEPEINIKVAAYFPHEYLPDVGERVNFYRKLSSCTSESEIEDVEQEIRDRLGTPPEEVLNLLGMMTIKLYLKPLHVTHMNCGPKKTSLQFAETTPVSPEKIISLIQKKNSKYSITPDHKLVFEAEDKDWRSQLRAIQEILSKLDL